MLSAFYGVGELPIPPPCGGVGAPPLCGVSLEPPPVSPPSGLCGISHEPPEVLPPPDAGPLPPPSGVEGPGLTHIS